jgi:hypothetical protein
LLSEPRVEETEAVIGRELTRKEAMAWLDAWRGRQVAVTIGLIGASRFVREPQGRLRSSDDQAGHYYVGTELLDFDPPEASFRALSVGDLLRPWGLVVDHETLLIREGDHQIRVERLTDD